jgi:cob(I)alamin adenosyltransferase
MGITTKTGDDGRTDLGSGKRVPKDDPRVEALGEVDELSSLLGFARLSCRLAGTRDALDSLQRDLVRVAAELASVGAPLVDSIRPGDEESLSARILELEARTPLRGFVLPGRTEAAARIDLARARARSLERRVVALARGSEGGAAGSGSPVSAAMLAYLNRLSDCLFMLARAEEAAEGKIEYR